MGGLVEDLQRADFWVYVLLQLCVLTLCVLAIWNRAHRVRRRIACFLARLRRGQPATQTPHCRTDNEGRVKYVEASSLARAELSATLSVKRGERSWRRLYTAHAISILVFVQVLSTARVSFLEGWRSFVSVANIGLLSYLVFLVHHGKAYLRQRKWTRSTSRPYKGLIQNNREVKPCPRRYCTTRSGSRVSSTRRPTMRGTRSCSASTKSPSGNDVPRVGPGTWYAEAVCGGSSVASPSAGRRW